jgi:hypothetical protein
MSGAYLVATGDEVARRVDEIYTGEYVRLNNGIKEGVSIYRWTYVATVRVVNTILESNDCCDGHSDCGRRGGLSGCSSGCSC